MPRLREAHEALVRAAKLAAEQSIDFNYAATKLIEESGGRPERIVCIWARIPNYPPQFVVAFHESVPESHDQDYFERRLAAEKWFKGFLEDGEPVEFFETYSVIPSPQHSKEPGGEVEG